MNPLSFLGSPAGAVAGDLGGSVISGLFNAREADKNRDWQTAMSNTAYQRAAGDLEAAGLNRILALGSPASTPGGSSASISSPSLGSTMTNAKVAHQNIAVGKENEALIKEQRGKTIADTALSGAQRENVITDTALKLAQTDWQTASTALQWKNILKVTQDIEESKARTGNYVADTAVKNELPAYWSALARSTGAEADKQEVIKRGYMLIDPLLKDAIDSLEGTYRGKGDSPFDRILSLLFPSSPSSEDLLKALQQKSRTNARHGATGGW